MISRSASRRCRRTRMGEGRFRHQQKLMRRAAKVRCMESTLATGVSVVRDTETGRFVGLRQMLEQAKAWFSGRREPQFVNA